MGQSDHSMVFLCFAEGIIDIHPLTKFTGIGSDLWINLECMKIFNCDMSLISPEVFGIKRLDDWKGTCWKEFIRIQSIYVATCICIGYSTAFIEIITLFSI